MNSNQVDILPFGPHVVMTEASDEFIQILLEKGKEIRNPEHDHTKALAGRIKNEYLYEDPRDWFVPLFEEHVFNYLRTTPYGLTRENLDRLDVVRWDLYALWINYQKCKEYNPPHNHTGDLSFIIYPDIPDVIREERGHDNVNPGNVVFEYGDRHFSNFLSFNNIITNIQPYTGLILIFPAWLSHHVYAFESDVERVSVSGNIKLQHDFYSLMEK